MQKVEEENGRFEVCGWGGLKCAEGGLKRAEGVDWCGSKRKVRNMAYSLNHELCSG